MLAFAPELPWHDRSSARLSRPVNDRPLPEWSVTLVNASGKKRPSRLMVISLPGNAAMIWFGIAYLACVAFVLEEAYRAPYLDDHN